MEIVLSYRQMIATNGYWFTLRENRCPFYRTRIRRERFKIPLSFAKQGFHWIRGFTRLQSDRLTAKITPKRSFTGNNIHFGGGRAGRRDSACIERNPYNRVACNEHCASRQSSHHEAIACRNLRRSAGRHWLEDLQLNQGLQDKLYFASVVTK